MDTSEMQWDDAQTFLAVVEAGSISGGAKQLGLGQPTVSRRIALLEERLGMALFQRTQQGARVTEAGARLLPAAEQMARWAGEFGRIARGAESAPEGLVRIASPPAIAVDVVAPLAAELETEHPAIRLEILASVSHVDLVRGEADLAIRTRPPREPELTTLASDTIRTGVYAAPDYVAALAERRAATGRTGPAELAELDWITWARPFEHVPPRPMLARAIPDFVPAFTSDDYLVQRAAAVAGLGAMILDERGAASVGLEAIDVGFAPPETSFGLVCAKSARHVPRIRLVADWIARQMAVINDAVE